ncbi:MAG: 6-phosphofructokinase [Clostridia bacterium]|nr:6-phosphofructokinase [Clostridia bacterium]
MQKNLLIGQSGGPTAAINATLAGVIQAGIDAEQIGTVYGAINGIKGVLNENFINLSEVFSCKDNIRLLKQTPSAYLGSCRYKLSKSTGDIENIVEILNKNNIGYFCYIGGNDSMDTVYKLKDACAQKGIKVMGVPKTIDNDLVGTDHCPGFGSAAKYIASTIAEITRDTQCYSIESVTIVEIMGRNAGWLTAASALARLTGTTAPDLIYLPEIPFDIDRFLTDVKEKIVERKNIVIAVSEGIKDTNGNYIADQSEIFKEDLFGHSQLGGVGKALETLVKDKYGIKVRSIELNTPQRCAAHISSKTDIEESFMIGAAAVKAALNGETGKMMCYKRVSDKPYKIDVTTMEIDSIANSEKKIPREYITKSGNDVTQELVDYIYPLIQGENEIMYKDGLPMHFIR